LRRIVLIRLVRWPAPGVQPNMVASIPGLADEQKRRVLGRNAIAWFGLTADELPDTSVYFQREPVLATQRE
jgi:hypothetical protein